MKIVRFVASASALALALVSLACSGTDPVSDAVKHTLSPDSVHAAPERARDAGTAKMELRMEMKIAGQKATATSSGEIDFVNSAATQTMKIQGLTVEMVMLDGILYSKGPLTEEWTTTDVEEMQRLSGINPENLNTNNPVQQMDALADLEDIELVAEEKVRGVPTTHFRGYTDVVKQISKLSSGDPQAEEMAALVGSMLKDPRIPTDVWIDGEGRATRISFSVTYDFSRVAAANPEFAGAAEIGEMTMKMDLEYFDWGTPVQIEAPTE